jgi:hypothetical protein
MFIILAFALTTSLYTVQAYTFGPRIVYMLGRDFLGAGEFTTLIVLNILMYVIGIIEVFYYYKINKKPQ